MSWLLAYGISNTLVALPLAGLAYLLGEYSRRPALAHLVWIAVLVKLLTPPLLTVPLGFEITSAASQSGTTETNEEAARSIEQSRLAIASDLVARQAARAEATANKSPVLVPQKRLDRRATMPASRLPLVSLPTLLTLVAWGWIAGSAVVGFRALYSGWRFQRVLKQFGRSDDWLSARLANVARQAGLSGGPEVLVVEGTFSPMLWGPGRRAKLVFPSELALRLDREACDSLLLHELAHYSRRDHWVRLLELSCQIAFWWNPIVWLARRGIEASEELCCDAWVVARQKSSPRSYAEALLATIDFLNEESLSLPPIASGLGEISLLRRRLTRIMLGDLTVGLSPLARLATVLSIVAIAPLGPALLASSGANVDALAPQVQSQRPMRLTSQQRLPRAPREAATRPVPETMVATVASMPQLASGPARLKTPADHWATALSPSGKHQIEARGGLKAMLVDVANRSWNVDFTSNRITSVSFGPDDRFATGQEGDFHVRIWDAAGGFLAKLEGAQAIVKSVAFSPTGELVAAGVADGSVLVWDVASGEKVAQLDAGAGVSCVRWSPTGDRLAISCSTWNDASSGSQVLIWDPQQTEPEADFSLDRPVSAIVWPRDRVLAAVAWDGAGLMWEVPTGDVLAQFEIGKDLPSSAAWSPDCPPVRQWVEGALADVQR